jgi:hypothetical protein
MRLQQLSSRTEGEFKKWSSVNYFVQSATFKFIYDKASAEDKKKLVAAATNGDKKYFKKFTKERKQELEPFEQFGCRKLRGIAKYLGITGYWNMNKVTLVEEINYEVNRIKADSQQVIDQSEK